MDDNGTAPPVTDDLTVLSVEASDELRLIVLAWLDEVWTAALVTDAHLEIFRALGIDYEDG